MRLFRRASLQETLPPSVAAAMDALRPAPTPNRGAWEARRQAFLTEARQYAAQAVPSAPVLRHKSWKDLFVFNPKEVSMKAFVKVLMALALIFGATAGTVSASQGSVPGSVLYPIKLQYEDARLSLTQDPEAKVLLAMAYAQERVDEAAQLAEDGDEIPASLAARYQLQVGLALQTMAGLGEAQQLQLRAHLSGTLENQVRVMAQVRAQYHLGENAEHPEPTQAMIKTMEQAQQALGYAEQYAGENETPGNVGAPGPNPDAHGNGLENGDNGEGNAAGNAGENGGNGGDTGGNGGDAGGYGVDNGGHNGQSEGNDDQSKGKQQGRDDTGKPSSKGRNGEGGRPDDGGNVDNGNPDSGNGGPDNGGADNGGSDNGGSDTGGGDGQGGNGGGTGGGNGGSSGGGGGN